MFLKLMGLGVAIASLSLANTTIVSTVAQPFHGIGFEAYDTPLPGTNAYGVEWSQSDAWDNVQVAAGVMSTGSGSSIDAWITDSSGDVLFSNLDTVIPAPGAHLQIFFSGLSLDPGTYWFMLAPPPPDGPTTASWINENGAAFSSSSDATYLGSYTSFGTSEDSPLSAHPQALQDDGDALQFSVISVSPEPTTTVMLAGGLLFCLAARRGWRQRAAR